MKTLSKSQFARRLHVSPPRVSQLIAKGMPTTPEGRVDVAQALAWIESHVDSMARRLVLGVKIRDAVMALPARMANRLPAEWRRQVLAVAEEEARSVLAALSDEFISGVEE